MSDLYGSQPRRIDTLIGDSSKFLNRLFNCRKDYKKEINPGSESISEEFFEWVKETYGVQVILEQNNITGKFEIVNEDKYMLFVLKYS